MSALFKQLDGDCAVLHQDGVYKQVDLYVRNDGELYAKASGGFIRVNADGATSKSGVTLNALVTECPLYKDPFGRLCVAQAANRKPLEADPSFLAIEKGN